MLLTNKITDKMMSNNKLKNEFKGGLRDKKGEKESNEDCLKGSKC